MLHRHSNHTGVIVLILALFLALPLFPTHAQAAWAKLVHRGDDPGVPPDAVEGDLVTIGWILENTSSINAVNYSLAEFGTTFGAGATYPTFTINAGETATVRIENFPVPPIAIVYFSILDEFGNRLSDLPQGGLWADFNDGGPNLCFPPNPPPGINYVDVIQTGEGSAITSTGVSGPTSGVPSFEHNGETGDMEEMDNSDYGSGVETQDGTNEGEVTVQGVPDYCDVSASFFFQYLTTTSGNYGSYGFKEQCGGFSGTEADPISTAVGNFVHSETDTKVAGLAETALKLERTYNSQSVFWTPASIYRFTESGGEPEMITGPTQYFGKGWTSTFGEYLLVIDRAPIFDGLQILYADGHTATFESNGGGTYSSDSPINFDSVVKDGDDYLLYQDSCGCSLEYKRFNSDGQLIALSDRNGNQITLTYDGDNLASVENASGRRIVFESDSDNRIVRATLPEGIVLSYEYTDGMLTAFTDGRGGRTQYVYDADGQMTELISPNGYPEIRNTYDDEHRVVEQIVGESEKYSFGYDDNQTSITDAYSNVTIHHYDDKERLIKIVYPDGTEENFGYDDKFNKTYYQDQTGQEWLWAFDEKGNRLTADGPLGWHREWKYNDQNQVIQMTEKVDDATYRTHTYQYDSKGNLTGFCNPLGDCGSIGYSAQGLPLELTDYAGNITFHTFDVEGDLVSITNAEGATTRFDHDGLGRTIELQKPLGSIFNYSFDANNNLVTVTGPMGWQVSFEFDQNDLLTAKTDPNGGLISYDYNDSDKLALVKNQLDFDVAGYSYGLMNELTGFTNALGRSWAYEHDEMLRVIHTAGPLDTYFYYAYNPTGERISVTDANGIITHTELDPLYRPIAIVQNYLPGETPNAGTNVTTAFTYNLPGEVLSITDPEGFVTEYVNDLLGRRISKRDAEGFQWQYSYNPVGKMTEVINPRGFTKSFQYDAIYQVTEEVNQEGHSVQYQYDDDERLTDKIDANGVITHYEYDELGRLIRLIENYKPAFTQDSETNVTTEMGYDLAGNLVFLTNPRGYTAQFIYDAAHRRTEIVDFESGNTKFAYDPLDNLLSIIDAKENPTALEYDELDRLIARINAENETENYQYDHMANMTHRIEADGTVKFFGYDDIYRLIAVTENYHEGVSSSNDTNVLTQYGYDARGLLKQITNANNAVTAFDYNKVGKVTQEIDPLGNTWQYSYDGQRNRIGRIDANGEQTQYSYYPDDMLQAIQYADATSVGYQYDPNNNRIEMIDTLGDTSWTFDPLNRVTKQNDPFDRVLSNAFDAAGNRTVITYPDGNQVQYAYSPNNWLESMTDPDDKIIQYTRDKVGNVTHIANPNNTQTDLAYDKVYRTLSVKTVQTVDEPKIHSAFEYIYNEIGHVTQAAKEYGWRNPPKISETYQYDGLHRLIGTTFSTSKKKSDDEVMAYSYDAVGNRLSWNTNDDLATQTPDDGFSKAYSHNAANQLLSVATDSIKVNGDYTSNFQYDPNGSRTNKEDISQNGPIYGTDYAYDLERRLLEALDYQLVGSDGTTDSTSGKGHDNTKGAGHDKAIGKGHQKETEPGPIVPSEFNRVDRAISYLEYDGGGRRLAKTYDPKLGAGGEKRVEYVFDGLDPVAEYNLLNGQRGNFYRGAHGWIAQMHNFASVFDPETMTEIVQGHSYWFHYNRKGDMAGLTKHNGNSHHTYRYDPYGDVIPRNGNFTDPHNHYTLTGKEYDEKTNLIYFGARHYDPLNGVWLTQDTYRGEIPSPASLHRYGFVEASPITYFDPFGFAKFKTRPLVQVSGTYLLKTNSVLTFVNAEAAHEHIFFEDGRSIGWSGNSTFFHEDSGLGSGYGFSHYTYNDDNEDGMVKLAAIIEARRVRNDNIPYSILGFGDPKKYNCQNYTANVRKKYKEIKKNKSKYEEITQDTEWLNTELDRLIENNPDTSMDSLPVDIQYKAIKPVRYNVEGPLIPGQIRKPAPLYRIYPSDPGYVDPFANIA